MGVLLIIIHFIVTILLMIVILLQSSKGGGLAGVFGGGGLGTVFGGRGAASFLSKVTTVLATLFLGLSLLISYIDKGRTVDQSVVAEEMARRRASSPAAVLPTVPTDESANRQSLPKTAPTTPDTSN